jgi:hypothetical protein
MTTEHSALTTISLEHLRIVSTGDLIRTETWHPCQGQLLGHGLSALGEMDRCLALSIDPHIIERPEHNQKDCSIPVVRVSNQPELTNVLDGVVLEFITGLLEHPEAPPQVPTKGVRK